MHTQGHAAGAADAGSKARRDVLFRTLDKDNNGRLSSGVGLHADRLVPITR
jgi:hypothetical protein